MRVKESRRWRALPAPASLFFLYLILQNGLWTPSSDSDFYLTLARNLARSGELAFNELPVVKIPPGWPFTLSAAMRLSPSFAFLNLMPMILMLVYLAVWNRILIRLTDPATAGWATLATGLLFAAYKLSSVQYSDPMFLAIYSLTVLAALKARRKALLLAGALMATGACMAVTVRWAGVICLAVYLGALAQHCHTIELKRQMPLASVLFMLMLATFVGTRLTLQSLGDGVDLSHYNDYESTLAVPRSLKSLLNPAHYGSNLARAGNWISWLLWPPMELGQTCPAVGIGVNILGFIILGFYLLHIIRWPPEERWLWVGGLLYFMIVATIWTRPNVRYVLPIAPMLLAGAFGGIRSTAERFRHPFPRTTSRVVLIVAVVSVIGTNAGLYLVSARVARSDNFYSLYNAGEYDQLISISEHIRLSSNKAGPIVVSPDYININRPRVNTSAFRSLAFLTGRQVRFAPASVAELDTLSATTDWMKQIGARFYVNRPPVSPWRVWHFRAPALQKMITGHEPKGRNPFFELYMIEDGKLVEVGVKKNAALVKSVPCLQSEHSRQKP